MITYVDRHFVRVFQSLDTIQELTPKAFEYFSKFLLEKLGYEQVRVSEKHGPYGADGGIDLYAAHNGNLVVGQCKRHSMRSSRNGFMKFEYVQALGGAMLKTHATEGVFISTLPFSKTSQRYADSVNMRLIGPDEITAFLKNEPAEINDDVSLEYPAKGREVRRKHQDKKLPSTIHSIARYFRLKELFDDIFRRLLGVAVLLTLFFLAPYWLPIFFKVTIGVADMMSAFAKAHPFHVQLMQH